MNTPRLIAIAGAVTALAGLGIAFREARVARLTDTSLLASLRRRDSLRNEVEQLERHRKDLDSSLTRLRQKTAATAAINSPISTESLEAQLQQKRMIHSFIDLRYRAFFSKLGLTADQAEQAENIMIKHQESISDIIAAAAKQGVAVVAQPVVDPAVAQLLQSEQAQYNSELEALLGADEFAEFQQYNRSSPAGGIVDEVAGKALGSGPISAAQGEQLTQILANASPEYQKGGTVNLNTIDWDAAEAQAQKVLSPQQFAALQSTAADTQVRHQLIQLTSAFAKQSP